MTESDAVATPAEQRAHVHPNVPWPEQLDLLVFDFDGVMTDNRVIVAQDGSESVVCHRGDGLGIERLRLAGISMLVLSKERNPVVLARCEKLQIRCLQAVDNKREALMGFLHARNILPANVIYVGNDINDSECLELVGLPVLVADAHKDVRPLGRLTLTTAGGQGAVRELADTILQYYQPPSSERVMRSNA